MKTVDITDAGVIEAIRVNMPVGTTSKAGLLSVDRNTDTFKFHMGGIHNAIRLSISEHSHIRNSFRIFCCQAAQNMCFDATIHLYDIRVNGLSNIGFFVFHKDRESLVDFVFAYKTIDDVHTELYLVYTGEASSDANVVYIKPMGVSSVIRNNMMLTNIEDLSEYTVVNPTSI